MFDIYSYYADNGGLINGAIFLVAVAVLYIGFGKLLQFRKIAKGDIQCKTDPSRRCFCSIHRMVFCQTEHSWKYHKNQMREKLLMIIPELEAGLDTMATLIQVAPFLGLFGTVAGMIQTFSLITTWGNTNPVILTEGITVSLLTTQAGLLVAFPCMLFHNYLLNRKNALEKAIIAEGEAILTEMAKKEDDHDVR
ncbi:MAG: MotA/TolQ/ExbB proton channel family protein [Chitinivibrionales bacterium]